MLGLSKEILGSYLEDQMRAIYKLCNGDDVSGDEIIATKLEYRLYTLQFSSFIVVFTFQNNF